MFTYFKLAMILLFLHPLASSTESMRQASTKCKCSRDCDPIKTWEGSKDKVYICGLPLNEIKKKDNNKQPTDVPGEDWKCYQVQDWPEPKAPKGECPKASVEFVARISESKVASNNSCALGLKELITAASAARLVLL